MNRISWNEYFMSMAKLAGQRSTCIRRQIGAILVRGNQVLSTGYNGVPKGLTHCAETGCVREQKGIPSGERAELCRACHAEQNAVIQAACHGVSIKGSTLYCECSPCSICAKMLINAGVVKIYYQEKYPDELSDTILEESGIEVIKLKGFCNENS